MAYMKSMKSKKFRKSVGKKSKRFSTRAKQGGRRGRKNYAPSQCPACGSYDFIPMEDANGSYWGCRDCHYLTW